MAVTLIYLALAIICSSSIAIIFKYTETRKMNRHAITTFNYLIAVIISFLIILYRKISVLNFNPNRFMDQIYDVIFFSSGKFSAGSSIIWAVLVGVPAGILFFLAFIYYQKSVYHNGVGLAGAFSKLGIVIPTFFSILVWNEIPTPLQWVGIFLSLISIVLINVSIRDFDSGDIRFSLILLLFFGGLAEFSNKIFQKYALIDFKIVFLLFVFFSAFLTSFIFLKYMGRSFERNEVILGSIVGVPNLFSAFFLILALDSMKASLVFPIFSATSIVVINLAGFFLFKEEINGREKFSIILTIIALILINLK